MKHPEVVLALVGVGLVAAGLYGTFTSSNAARAASASYEHDCVLFPLSPDCTQRAVAISTYNAETVMYEAWGLVGFVFLLATPVVGLSLRKRQKRVGGQADAASAR